MTHEQAIEIAKARFSALNRARWQAWTIGTQEPNEADFGYRHGWFSVGEFKIGSNEYAPGPTYNVD